MKRRKCWVKMEKAGKLAKEMAVTKATLEKMWNFFELQLVILIVPYLNVIFS